MTDLADNRVMHPMMKGWAACPTCGGDLVEEGAGARCTQCETQFGALGRWLDLVDTKQKVSSEGPGDTLAMAWRRRRWDELRGPEAPENSDYLAAIWERLRPDDRVLDLACGPASFLAWIADFGPDLAILGIDLSAAAIEEADRIVGDRPNVALARASTRRRLPVYDGSCDVVLRRLAPGLPEEVVRVLAPGGWYLRFTFGPGHWREIYDLMPGLPRAREDALAGEAERMRDLGLEVEEPIRHQGTEELTSAAVMLALRSNPAAFHADRLDFKPMRGLWDDATGGRRQLASLSTEYAILVARKPVAAALAETPEKPKRTRKKAADVPPEAEPAAVQAAPDETPAVEEPAAAERPKRTRRAKAEPAAAEAVEEVVPAAAIEAAPVADAEKPKRSRRAKPPAEEPIEAAAAPPPEKPKRARRKKDEPAAEVEPTTPA